MERILSYGTNFNFQVRPTYMASCMYISLMRVICGQSTWPLFVAADFAGCHAVLFSIPFLFTYIALDWKSSFLHLDFVFSFFPPKYDAWKEIKLNFGWNTSLPPSHALQMKGEGGVGVLVVTQLWGKLVFNKTWGANGMNIFYLYSRSNPSKEVQIRPHSILDIQYPTQYLYL
jgi:hypothetical protein